MSDQAPVATEIGVGKQTFHVVDSHTGGEATRVVVRGWPAIAGATMRERWQTAVAAHDGVRQALICEPRGGENFVGVVLTPPVSPDALAGVLFFAPQTWLTMCGHATIGTVVTLAHLGRVRVPPSRDAPPSVVHLDTPVGRVSAELLSASEVRIRNVPCFVLRRAIALPVPAELGAPNNTVVGDLAFGGNWNFLVRDYAPPCGLAFAERNALLRAAQLVRDALAAQGEKDGDGKPINFVQFFAPPSSPEKADSKNFVAFDGSFDRSACGTGTSAHMAQLLMHGELEFGREWRQESITGTVFRCSVEPLDASAGTPSKFAVGDKAVPTIVAQAFVIMEGDIFIDPEDPLRGGIV